VLWVVNGTTIQVALDGGHERVGYLGIEALGPSATEANRRLVQGQRVWLELDVPLRDGDGRLLAYVHVGDLIVNAELVRLGYAQVATVLPHGKYQELFLRLQREAQEAKRGVWGAK
jgi:micrococcal nuclease